jgi:hypothetical protein
MTAAYMTRGRAGHFARRVREGAQGSRHVRFSLGQLYATPGALSALATAWNIGKPYSVQRASESEDRMSLVLPYVRRHAWGDWGDVGPEDAQANERALHEGSRVFSAYALATGKRLWVITEADRTSTTVLLPDEY